MIDIGMKREGKQLLYTNNEYQAPPTRITLRRGRSLKENALELAKP